jgi:type I restriction enzyme S subunit
MEVREPSGRYLISVQRSELGEFPADWKVVKLGTFEPFITSGSRGWAAHYADIGSMFLRITNLSRSCIYPSLKDLRYVAVPLDNSEGVRTALKAGDILISITADIGIVGLVTEGIELPAYINQHIALVRIAPEDVNSRYLAYFLAGTAAQRRFTSMTEAGAKAGMNLAGVREILAALPPSMYEQTAISCALTDADALIDSLEQLLTKKLQIKQGAMQELLTGQRRLPGFIGKWEDRTLVDLADIRSGGTPSTRQPEFWGGDIPWCTPTDITSLAGAKYIAQTERSISGKGLKASSAEALPVGTVVMTSRATIGECAIASVPLTTNQGFKNFVPHSHTNGEFLYYLLGTQKSAFLALCSGSTFLEIGKRQLADFVVRCPVELDEQRAIADALSTMDTELTTLESRLTKARALKQAMAQALLTGRIRLIEPST